MTEQQPEKNETGFQHKSAEVNVEGEKGSAGAESKETAYTSAEQKGSEGAPEEPVDG